jgi:hypothetical protein
MDGPASVKIITCRSGFMMVLCMRSLSPGYLEACQCFCLAGRCFAHATAAAAAAEAAPGPPGPASGSGGWAPILASDGELKFNFKELQHRDHPSLQQWPAPDMPDNPPIITGMLALRFLGR